MIYTMNPPVETTSPRQRVTATRVGAVGSGMPRSLEQDLEIARIIAKAMDSSFSVGGIKFGLDAIIGLVPVAGDAVTLAIGMYPIFLARKHKLGKMVIGRMMANLGLDFVTGLVPFAGDAFDVLFKANLKNLKILEEAAAKRRLG
jgi:hypothetical protein